MSVVDLADEKRLRIAYLGHSITGDVNRTRYQRPKHLASMADLYLFVKKDTHVPEEIGSKATVVRSRFGVIPLYALWSVYKVWKLDRRVHFDLVYALYPVHSILQGVISKLLGFKWVADVWDHPEQTPGKTAGGIAQRLGAFISKRSLRHADLVVCAIVPEALEGYKIDKKRMLTVTNGTELSLAKPAVTRRDGSSRFTVFCVGPLHESRGIETLMEAVTVVQKRVPDLSLVLVGRVFQDAVATVNDWVLQHGLQESVEVLGPTNHQRVLELIAEADVCVCPLSDAVARRYAYPIKLFEYLAMGRSVVATGTPGVSQIVTNEVNGLLVDPGNASQMAEAILRVHDDLGLREKLESNARQSVVEYDWSRINTRIGNALCELTGKSGIGYAR
jgi:glycosyltransferase involved in cell wall biosynthesis